MRTEKEIQAKIDFHNDMVQKTKMWEQKRHLAFVECLTWVLNK